MKSIIVTGAGGNLGRAVADKFFAEKFNVAGTVLHDAPGKKEKDGIVLETSVVDASNETVAHSFVQSIVEQYGQVDVAVLTAGGFTPGSFEHTSLDFIHQQLRLNFDTAFTLAKAIFPQMKKQGSGHLFFTGSAPGRDLKKATQSVAYGLSKSLLFRLAELLREEADGLPVRITVIIPSIIDTPQNRAAMPRADFSKWTSPGKIADTIFKQATGLTPYALELPV